MQKKPLSNGGAEKSSTNGVGLNGTSATNSNSVEQRIRALSEENAQLHALIRRVDEHVDSLEGKVSKTEDLLLIKSQNDEEERRKSRKSSVTKEDIAAYVKTWWADQSTSDEWVGQITQNTQLQAQIAHLIEGSRCVTKLGKVFFRMKLTFK